MTQKTTDRKKQELLERRNMLLKKLDGLDDTKAKPIWDEYYKLEVEFARLDPQWKKKFCPRCGEVIGFSALSRTDNKTEICARCGKDDANNEFYKGQSLGGRYYRGKWIEWR